MSSFNEQLAVANAELTALREQYRQASERVRELERRMDGDGVDRG